MAKKGLSGLFGLSGLSGHLVYLVEESEKGETCEKDGLSSQQKQAMGKRRSLESEK